jgi:hypothetical protein
VDQLPAVPQSGVEPFRRCVLATAADPHSATSSAQTGKIGAVVRKMRTCTVSGPRAKVQTQRSRQLSPAKRGLRRTRRCSDPPVADAMKAHGPIGASRGTKQAGRDSVPESSPTARPWSQCDARMALCLGLSLGYPRRPRPVTTTPTGLRAAHTIASSRLTTAFKMTDRRRPYVSWRRCTATLLAQGFHLHTALTALRVIATTGIEGCTALQCPHWGTLHA